MTDRPAFALPFDPTSLDEDAFLAGPDRFAAHDEGDGDLLDVDSVFGKELERVIADQLAYDPGSIEPTDDALRTRSVVDGDYLFVDVPAGLLMLRCAEGGGTTVAGAYLGCDLAVGLVHRGRGLGKELALEYAMRNGWLPTWDLDEAAYTPEGEAAHRAAWAMAADRKRFERKRDRLVAAGLRSRGVDFRDLRADFRGGMPPGRLDPERVVRAAFDALGEPEAAALFARHAAAADVATAERQKAADPWIARLALRIVNDPLRPCGWKVTTADGASLVDGGTSRAEVLDWVVSNGEKTMQEYDAVIGAWLDRLAEEQKGMRGANAQRDPEKVAVNVLKAAAARARSGAWRSSPPVKASSTSADADGIMAELGLAVVPAGTSLDERSHCGIGWADEPNAYFTPRFRTEAAAKGWVLRNEDKLRVEAGERLAAAQPAP